MLCIPFDNRSGGTEGKNCLRYPRHNNLATVTCKRKQNKTVKRGGGVGCVWMGTCNNDFQMNLINIKLSSGAIRITLRFMLMSRCRAMQLHANVPVCEQAPDRQFGAAAHRSINIKLKNDKKFQ